MPAIFDTLVAFFGTGYGSVSQVEDQPILRFGVNGEHGAWTCVVQAREPQQQVLLFSICPVTVPPARRLAMAEFLTRANVGLVMGNFEMTWDDGTVRFKTSIDVEGDRLSPALLQRLVDANLFTMDRYLPGIMEIVVTTTGPAAVLAKIEGGEQPPP